MQNPEPSTVPQVDYSDRTNYIPAADLNSSSSDDSEKAGDRISTVKHTDNTDVGSAAEELLIRGLQSFSSELTLSGLQLRQFHIYAENLVKWNTVMNLTSVTEPSDIYVKHFLDSLSVLHSVPRGTFDAGISLIDVGTGAGFPGLPLAIAFPEVQVTLADSLAKRIRFLEDTVDRLKLTNVKLVHGRAEDLGQKADHREQYDLVVSRAVANLSTLSEYCIPLIRIGGRFIAYKGIPTYSEMLSGKKAARLLGAALLKEDQFILPQSEYDRTILVFSKNHATPAKYPRRAGTPSAKPLQ